MARASGRAALSGRRRNPETYVRRILVNTYSSWRRRKWNGEQATEQLPESAPGQSSFAAGRQAVSGQVDDRTDLWQALGRLPKKQRAVVVLRFYEDLSEIETAEVMQCSVGTVKSQASRALARLRLDPGAAPRRTHHPSRGGTMNTTELRDERSARAASIYAPSSMSTAVAGKIRATKRRRAAAIVGTACAVAVLAGVTVVTAGRSAAPLVPARASAPNVMVADDGMPYRAVPPGPGDMVRDGLRYERWAAAVPLDPLLPVPFRPVARRPVSPGAVGTA